MASNYTNSLYRDYEEILKRYESQVQLLQETNKLIKELNGTISSLNETIANLTEENETLKKEILRLKSQNDKDSSNSSKPSSTNGYKKVIINRREKTGKKQGGQKGHEGHKLDSKLEQFINSGNVLERIVEVNKTEKNKNKRYRERVVIDIKVVKTITRYRYYPDENNKYNIPKEHNQNVRYGSNVKTIAVDLMNNLYNSTDGVARFIKDITNEGISLSKGTLINWNNELKEKLTSLINKIETNLLNSYYINHDESTIKIDGENNNIFCACNKFNTRLWPSEHKSQESLDEVGFLPQFKGVIVKDGTELYNKYGICLSQCLSHILRYLKGIYDYIPHKSPKELSEFLSYCNKMRNELNEYSPQQATGYLSKAMLFLLLKFQI